MPCPSVAQANAREDQSPVAQKLVMPTKIDCTKLRTKLSNLGLKKFRLILHLKFHLTGSLEAVTGQCIALNKQSKKQLEPL
jgi:hypothetical protein